MKKSVKIFAYIKENVIIKMKSPIIYIMSNSIMLIVSDLTFR